MLLGAYQSNLPLAVVATLGLIVSAVYSLWMIQRVFQGPNTHQWKLPDMTRREAAILADDGRGHRLVRPLPEAGPEHRQGFHPQPAAERQQLTGSDALGELAGGGHIVSRSAAVA